MQDTQANNIQKKLETLLSEHKELDDMINSMITTQVFDQLQLQRLKKKKLIPLALGIFAPLTLSTPKVNAGAFGAEIFCTMRAVSYTHLTLPTICSV